MHEKFSTEIPYYSFWETIGLGLLIFITFSVLQTGFLSGYYTFQLDLHHPDWSAPNLEASLLQSLIVNGDALAFAEIPSTILASLLILFFISRKKLLSIQNYLNFHIPATKQLLQWLAVMVLIIIIMEVINTLFDRATPDFITQLHANTNNFVLLWIAIIIGAPIFEELLFRGFIFEGLLHSPVGLIGATLIPAASWAIIHFQYGWYEIITIFLIGIILSIAKYITKSLYIPIAMHMLMNLTASVMMEFGTA